MLEPIKLPKFSGKKLEWETFKGMFESLVHDVPTTPPILKLQYLLGSLTGDAAHRMKKIKVTAANYESTWDAMVRGKVLRSISGAPNFRPADYIY